MKKPPASRLVRLADRNYRQIQRLAEKRQTTLKAVLDQLVEDYLLFFSRQKVARAKEKRND